MFVTLLENVKTMEGMSAKNISYKVSFVCHVQNICEIIEVSYA